MLRRFRPELPALLGLLALPLGLFWAVTFGSRTLIPADNLIQFEPWRSAAPQLGVGRPHNELLSDLLLENFVWKRFIVESLGQGEIPMWNPYLFAGVPFLATGQHSALYPFTAIFYLPGMPVARAYGFFIVSQFFLSGAFTYLFLRVLLDREAGRPARLGALIGAMTYQLSLFMVVSVVFPMIVAGAIWLPLFLTSIEWLVTQRPLLGRPASLPWLALGAAAVGCIALAGHPEILYYALLIGGAYSLWRLIGVAKERGEKELGEIGEVKELQSEGLPGNNLESDPVGSPPPSDVTLSEAKGLAPHGLQHSASMPDSSPLAVSSLSSPSSFSSFSSLLFRRAAYLLAMVALGLALGAVQLMSLVEAVRDNFRVGSATFQQVLDWGYPPRQLLAFVAPNAFGNPSHHEYFDLFTGRWTPATVNSLGQAIEKIDWGPPITNYVEGGAYVGLLPLLLAPIAIFGWLTQTRKRKEQYPSSTTLLASRSPADAPRSQVPFFTVLALLCLAFAFGTPLYALIFWLPGINQLHSPFRWVWPLTLCAAVLAGYGATYLQQLHEGAKGTRGTKETKETTATSQSDYSDGSSLSSRSLRSLISFSSLVSSTAIGLGVAALASLVILRLFWDRFEPAVSRVFLGLAVAPTAFADARMFFSYEARQVFLFALLLIASGIVLRLSRCPIYLPAWLGRRPAWEAAAVVVLAVDLLAAGGGFNPAADPRLLEYTPPVVEFLKQDQSLWRFTTFDPDGRKPFNANTGWLFDLQDVRGYDSIIPRQYANYMALIESQGELQFNRIAPISNLQSLDSPLLDLLNVKYVISLVEIPLPKYRLVYDAEVKVYENLGAAPRAFTLPAWSALALPDVPQAFSSLDPRQYVLFDAGASPPVAPEARAGTLQPAEVTAYGANEVTVQAEVAEASYLILADSFATGWRAFVRPAGEADASEQETPIYRADANFRGVRLEPGAWSVRFKYSPMSIRLGAFISLMAGLVLALAAGGWLWRMYYRETALDSTARRVAKNSLAPMALNLFNRLIDLVFAAFMLRILGPADAGKYYFAVVIIIWFDTLTGFGLNTFLTREVARDRTGANRYLANTTILRLALGAIGFVVLVAGVYVARQWLGLANDTALAILLLALGLMPGSISAGLTALFQAYEKHEYPAAVTTVTTILKVGLGAAALAVGYGFVGLAGTSIVVNLATMLILGVLATRLLFTPRLEYEGALQRRMLLESGPLMINNLLAGLFFKVDVALLEPIRNARQPGLGSREVGWYSTAYKFVEAYNIIPSLFTFAMFPVMSRQAGSDRAALARSYALSVKLLFFTAAPLAAASTFLAHLLVGALGGSEYLPHGAIALQLMIWSIPFGWINSLTNYLLIALGQQRALTRAFLIGLGFNVIANLIFLPRYGYPAAAIITIFSEIVEGIPFYLTLRKAMAPVPWLRLLWKPAAAVGAMLGLMAWLWPIQPLLALLLGIVVYLGLAALLRVFDPNEWAILIDILPSRLRRRVAPHSVADD